MEPDDLLCSRSARPRKALVGRAHSRIDQATLENEMGNWEDCTQLGSFQSPINRVIVRCGLADSLFEHPATVNIELWAEDIAMKKSKGGVLFVIGLLTMVGLYGCSQETPMEKTKAAAASV